MVSLGVALMALCGLSIALRAPVEARPLASTRYVSSVTGSDTGDCADPAAPCKTIQYAIDQSLDGDELRIAALDNSTSARYTATTSSVVALTKSLTLRGGYVYQHVISSTWIIGALPSTIDGEAARRVIEIHGPVTPTLEWLSFVNGSAAQGGNVYAENANLTLIAVSALSGTAQSGGGLYLKNCHSTIDVTSILSGNIPSINGLALVQGNSAQSGGGIYIDGGNPLLLGVMVMSNTATQDGGGLYLNSSAAIIAVSSIYANTSINGAGAYVNGPLSPNPLDWPILVNNYVRHNTASGNGGGVSFQQAVAVLINNIVADNAAPTGAGLYLYGSSPQAFYDTLANNTGGSGLYLTHVPGSIIPPVLPIPSLPSFTNTLIVSHTVGASVASTGLFYPFQNRATFMGTVWWANSANTGGAGEVVSSTNVFSNPLFTCIGDVPDCLAPYHIMTDSAAVDAGLAVVIPGLDRAIDIDWQLRPARHGFDIGADEVPDQYGVFVLPLTSTQTITPGRSITHTHLLFNTGMQSDTYTLTVRSDHAWASLAAASPIFLAAQSVTNVQVRVDVPLAAMNGITDTVIMTITSWGDPARSLVVTDTTGITGGIKLYLPVVLDQTGS
jgi:hypothetical protein